LHEDIHGLVFKRACAQHGVHRDRHRFGVLGVIPVVLVTPVPENAGNYLWLGFAALCGVFARAARWTTVEGQFDWQKAVFECMTAPAIGLIAGGATAYFSPNLDPMILGAIAASLGLLGPAAIEAILIRFFNAKIGS